MCLPAFAYACVYVCERKKESVRVKEWDGGRYRHCVYCQEGLAMSRRADQVVVPTEPTPFTRLAQTCLFPDVTVPFGHLMTFFDVDNESAKNNTRY